MRLLCLSILFALALIPMCPARASPATPLMPEGGLEFFKSHEHTLKSSDRINDRLFQPALSGKSGKSDKSGGVELGTLDGKRRTADHIQQFGERTYSISNYLSMKPQILHFKILSNTSRMITKKFAK